MLRVSQHRSGLVDYSNLVVSEVKQLMHPSRVRIALDAYEGKVQGCQPLFRVACSTNLGCWQPSILYNV